MTTTTAKSRVPGPSSSFDKTLSIGLPGGNWPPNDPIQPAAPGGRSMEKRVNAARLQWMDTHHGLPGL
jgi:hypothetical protein